MWKIGDVEVYSVFETDATAVITEGVADATPEEVAKIDWLRPSYADEQGNLLAVNQAFVLKTPSQTIIIDPPAGNNRERTDLSEWSNMDNSFLDNLREVVDPTEVDIVLVSHMHFDHSGWCTYKTENGFEPLFPNARHVFVRDEYEYWAAGPTAELGDDKRSFYESIKPVFDAGLVDLVDSSYQVTDELQIIPTPGHTPNHVSFELNSDGEVAIFGADILHHPCQVARPDWMSFDTDEATANITRKAILERAVTDEIPLFIMHFADSPAGRVIRDGNTYKFVPITS